MIPLAVPNLTGNEKRYLDNCIDTTFVSSVGEYVVRLEEMVVKATEGSAAVATSSGTTGLHAALTAVGVGYNDLVIIPTFTFIATANAVKHCGADPWLMDIDNDSWCLNPCLVKAEIEKHCKRSSDGILIHALSGKRVAALMPVYTLGNVPNMDAFREIADLYDLPLVVDAACAIGATFDEKSIGSLADLSVLSFNGNKTITCGGGGAVVVGLSTNAKKWGESVRHLTTTARVWPDYDFDEVGFNYRMTNIQAAVGCAQMEQLERFVERKCYVRRFYMERLGEALAGLGISLFPTTKGSSCWFSGLVMPEGTNLENAKEVVAGLKDNGIEARTFWKPVHLQKPYMSAPVSVVSVSERLWERIITLPCSTGITEEELECVVGAVEEVCKIRNAV